MTTDTVLDTTGTLATLTAGAGATTGAIDAVPETGSSNTTVDHDWYKVSLIANHKYTFSGGLVSGQISRGSRDETGGNEPLA